MPSTTLNSIASKRLTTVMLCKDLHTTLGSDAPREVKCLIAGIYSNSHEYYWYAYQNNSPPRTTIEQFNKLFDEDAHTQSPWANVMIARNHIDVYDSLETATPDSYMSPNWTLPVVDQVFSAPRKERLNKLRDVAQLPHIEGNDVFALVETVEWLKSFLQLGDVRTYVTDGKVGGKTKKAIWDNKSSDERKQLPVELHSSKSYRNAVDLAGIFQGRLDNMLAHAMTQECAMMDKHGIFSLDEDKEYDIHTLVWCLLLMSELNVRKAFTLESQMHGGLNPFLQTYLDKFLAHRSETDWGLIASLCPSERTLEHVPDDIKSTMLDEWMYRLNGLKVCLKNQWDLGVHNCTGDGGKHPAWTVPMRGSGVDSGCWNAVTGTWNNALRHIKILSSQLGIACPLLFTCPKLTAGDQAQWAYAEQKETDPKILALTELIHGGVRPWAVLDGADSNDVLTKIVTVASKHGVPLERFLGLPKERATEIRAQYDMICGVAVHGIGAEMASVLKSAGFAGAHASSSST